MFRPVGSSTLPPLATFLLEAGLGSDGCKLTLLTQDMLNKKNNTGVYRRFHHGHHGHWCDDPGELIFILMICENKKMVIFHKHCPMLSDIYQLHLDQQIS